MIRGGGQEPAAGGPHVLLGEEREGAQRRLAGRPNRLAVVRHTGTSVAEQRGQPTEAILLETAALP